MTKYVLSSEFEKNTIDDKCILFSQDCRKIYEANVIETIIVTQFEKPCSIGEVEEKCRQIEGFNREEFYDFINDIINKHIIVLSK